MVVPILVGVGRITERRLSSLEDARDPIHLSAEATKRALADAGVNANAIEAIAFIDMFGESRLPRRKEQGYKYPAVSLKRLMNMDQIHIDQCYHSELGGSMPLNCLHELCDKIVSGEFHCALLTGAEALDTLVQAKKKNMKFVNIDSKNEHGANVFPWGEDPLPGKQPRKIGARGNYIGRTDVVHGLGAMPCSYAVIEQAHRYSHGVTFEERQRENSSMFSGFSSVAANDSVNSWFPIERNVDEILHVDDRSNRMIAFPYPKLMCAIMDVNQSASVIVMSDERARELEIPESKWVYIHGTADCADVSTRLLERHAMHRCLGMKIVGDHVFDNAKVPRERIDFFDVYSCFPIAVRLAIDEMKLPLDYVGGSRATVTGGLPYHGGAGNNYVSHSLVAMVEKLRENPGRFGLITANGGVLSKHAAAILSTTPFSHTHPNEDWSRPDCASALEAARKEYPPIPCVANPGTCSGTVQSYTIDFMQGKTKAKVIAIGVITSGTHTNSRFVAVSHDLHLVQYCSFHPDYLFNKSVKIESLCVDRQKNIYHSSFTVIKSYM